jgi:citrate synthase
MSREPGDAHEMKDGANLTVKTHEGAGVGLASQPAPWASAITATTDRHVFVRGVALDKAIGATAFPEMLLRLWRGDAPTSDEAELLSACLVAAIDHGPLSPSALVARTVASTRATPMSALAGGILAFGELHGAAVTRAMRMIGGAPPAGSLDDWATEVFDAERDAGRRLPGIGHRWHARDLRAERLIEVAAARGGSRHAAAVRALAARVAHHVGHPVAVNIDGALAVALSALRLDPEYGDFVFAIARSFGLAAHIVEERARERPMRLIDPTQALYDGVPVPDNQETD